MTRQVLLMAAIVALVACGKREEAVPPSPEPSADEAALPAETPSESTAPATARAVVNPTQGNTATGELTLTSDDGFVRISGQLTGLEPGSEHAIHIHEKGDCSAPDGSSAGEHFNPASQPHGNPDVPEHHGGDMYNISADDRGGAQIDNRAVGVTLRDGAAGDVLGKAIVVHEKADDYKTQPSGGSGKRIGCGAIE